MSAPSGRLSSSGVSIKQLIAKKDPSKGGTIQDISNLPMNDFGIDDLKMTWRRFAYDMKNQGKHTFFSALTKRDPILIEGTKYKMEVDNQTQIDYISPILSDLVDYLRSSLKNYSIEINIELTSNPDEEVKFLNGKDKFAALARKNPNLHTLKTTFNLDIEF
jgi:DNA polymerase-3 subunit gamma/tau